MHDVFSIVKDGVSLARAVNVLVGAIQIDKIYRASWTVDVSDAVLEPGADESQVRVGIARLAFFLLITQLLPQLNLIVAIVRIGREQFLKGTNKRVDLRPAVLQAGAKTLLQIARGRVQGAIATTFW